MSGFRSRETRQRLQRGFTLLEVMIAMTIMTLAFSAIYESQSQNLIMVTKTKEQNIAGWLARNKMVESEHLYEGKPFEELPKHPTTELFKSPFERYKWTVEIKELQFPEIPLSSGKDGDAVPEIVTLLAKVLTKFFNNSVREMVITVTWMRGDGEQHFSIATYLIDLNQQLSMSI